MPEHDYESLLASSIDQKSTDFSDHFNNIFISKLNTAINNRRTQIAQNMFGNKTDTDIDFENIESEE